MNALRFTKASVTNFVKCDGKYLFLLRSQASSVDAGRLNGVGGKLEPGENYLAAAVRETREETGYFVDEKDCTFHGILKIEGGYPEDWVVAFFSIEVPTQEVPNGMIIPEGQLLWLEPDQVLSTEYELVDDLRFLFPQVTAATSTFFATAIVNNQEKIDSISISTLPR